MFEPLAVVQPRGHVHRLAGYIALLTAVAIVVAAVARAVL